MATTTPTLPKHMRSAQWTTVPIESSLVLNTTTPLPKLANPLPKDATLVKISYASLNPVDYKLPEVSLIRYAKMGPGPWIPCCDYAGTVVSTTMSHVKPGDKVAGSIALPKYGTLAEYAVVEDSEDVAKMPEGVDLKDAATLGVVGQTALQCLVPYAKAGDHVVVNGASGGTGTFGVQIAKILGCTVTAICSGSKAELCKSIGADYVIDYKSVDVVEELKKGGLQYDLIIDNFDVGGPLYTQSHHYLKETGRYVTVAARPDLSAAIGMLKIRLQPAWLGGGRRKAGVVGRQPDKDGLEKLAGWIKEGKLKPVIEKEYALDQAAEAFKHLKSGRTRGKLVIKVSED